MDHRNSENQAAFVRPLNAIGPPAHGVNEFRIADGRMIATIIPNRYGEPEGTTTVSYMRSCERWQIMARGVWVSGQPHHPVAVHASILRFFGHDGHDGHDGYDEAELRVIQQANDWFRKCPALGVA